MSNTPEGYMEDSQGRLVPTEKISDVDMQRHELVKEIATLAREMQRKLIQFKGRAADDVDAFVELSAEQYGAKLGGKKGNVTLTSFDGRFQIKRQISEYLSFDERLQAAKALIDECLIEWSKDGNANLKALVSDAFQVDKEGRINRGRVLALRRTKIDDPRWEKAMEAIADSIQVEGTKEYLRVYERDGHGAMRAIVLDIAAL